MNTWQKTNLVTLICVCLVGCTLLPACETPEAESAAQVVAEVQRQVEIEACMSAADDRAIQAGVDQCVSKGVHWLECPAADSIREQHRKELLACQK